MVGATVGGALLGAVFGVLFVVGGFEPILFPVSTLAGVLWGLRDPVRDRASRTRWNDR